MGLLYKVRKYSTNLSPLISRIAFGGFWSITSNFLSKGILLLSSIIVAHIIGKLEYGQYSIIRTTIFLFIALASVGVGSLTTKYISQYRNSDIQKAYNIYIVSTFFSCLFGLLTVILIYSLAPWIASSQLNDASLTTSIRWGAFLLFFCTLNASQAGTLSGFESFKLIALNLFLSSIIELGFITLLAYYWGVNGALVGSACGYLFLTIVNNRHISRLFGCKVQFNLRKINRDEIGVIWKFGVPAALCNILVILALWMSRTYLVRETNFGEIAVYNVADQIKTFILFIPTSLASIILPILTNIKHTNKDTKSYKKVLVYNIVINVSITLFLGVIISLGAKPILSLWGKGFENPLVVIILCISAVFTSFATVVGQAISSQGKMWAGFLCNLVWAILVIGFAYYFINKGYGAVGLATAIALSYLIHSIYQYIYLRILIK